MFNSNVSLYQGHKTIAERGFQVGDKVHVGAAYSEKVGRVVGLNSEFPFLAKVRLEHKSGAATECWIKSENLLIYSKAPPLSRIDSSVATLFGTLYLGHETMAERGFEVGDKVHVGAAYSEKVGTIVGLDKGLPFRAKVRLDHKNGGATECWIKSENLLKMN